MNKEELKSIFLKIKENDIKGLEELYSQYHTMVYGIAFSIVKHKQDAEDIMQIVFEKIQKLDKTKLPSDKETTWLYTVTKNETLNYVKKKKGEISLDTIYEIESKNNEIDKKIDSIEFNQLIRKLNGKEQEIISLKILSDFSFQEISNLLNEPVGTVKWRYYKSLRSIKKMIGSLAMSVIAFTIGIKTMFTNMKTNTEQQETIQSEEEVNTNNQEVQNTSGQDNNDINDKKSQNEEQSKEMQEMIQEETEIKDEATSNTSTQENEIKQETIVEEGMAENQISYVGIGFIGISVIFFIMTIIFFIKYQLNMKKKLSK